MPSEPVESRPSTPLSAYRAGLRASVRSIFFYVLLGTYAGIGAIAHDFGFSVLWAMGSTLLIWAAPAQGQWGHGCDGSHF